MVNGTKGWNLSLVFCIFLTCAAHGQEWTRFRGPNGQGDVSCLRIETGQVLWSEKPGGRFYGSPVWVNGLLYCINRQGNLLVLKAAPTCELPAVNPLGEKSRATPAVAGGKMYLRTYSRLISIGGQAQ